MMEGLIKSLLQTYAGELENVEPTNNVSEFVQETLIMLIPEIDPGYEYLVEIIVKVFVLQANNDPAKVLAKFNKFTKAYIKFAKENLEE